MVVGWLHLHSELAHIAAWSWFLWPQRDVLLFCRSPFEFCNGCYFSAAIQPSLSTSGMLLTATSTPDDKLLCLNAHLVKAQLQTDDRSTAFDHAECEYSLINCAYSVIAFLKDYNCA